MDFFDIALGVFLIITAFSILAFSIIAIVTSVMVMV